MREGERPMKVILPVLAGNKDYNPYAQDRCCICGKKTGKADSWLLCARDPSGQEYAISRPSEAWREFDRAYIVPIGSICLSEHPELRHALIAFADSDRTTREKS